MVVFGTPPPDCVSVSDEVKPLPLVVEISKSAGAFMLISAVRALPETTKFCSAEAVPLQLVNAESGVPVTSIVGTSIDK